MNLVDVFCYDDVICFGDRAVDCHEKIISAQGDKFKPGLFEINDVDDRKKA